LLFDSLFVAEPLLLELVEELAIADDLLLWLGFACRADEEDDDRLLLETEGDGPLLLLDEDLLTSLLVVRCVEGFAVVVVFDWRVLCLTLLPLVSLRLEVFPERTSLDVLLLVLRVLTLVVWFVLLRLLLSTRLIGVVTVALPEFLLLTLVVLSTLVLSCFRVVLFTEAVPVVALFRSDTLWLAIFSPADLVSGRVYVSLYLPLFTFTTTVEDVRLTRE